MRQEENLWQQALRRRVWRRTVISGAFGLGIAGLGAVACGSKGKVSAPASGASPGTTPPGAPVKITASYDGVPNDSPLFVAKDAGIFQKNGLDVTLQQIPGPTSVAALLSGSIQADNAGTGEMLNAAAGGADVVLAATVIPVFTFKFYAQQGITKVADLKGKKLGITLPGGSFDQSIRAALPKFGLDPDKDVTLIKTGSIANVVSALLSGSIDGASIVVGPNSAQLESAGFKPLFDFASLKLRNAAAAIGLSRSYATTHRDVAQHFVDSYIEGLARFKRDKSLALQELGKIYQTNDQAVLNLTYDFYRRDDVMPPLPYPELEPLKNTQATLCASNAKLCDLDLSKLADPSFVKSAEERGLNKA